MNNDRRSVLQMLSEGKITTDEADRLLSALDGPAAAGESRPALGPKVQPKYLRVTVHADVHGDNTKVNVRVPLALLRAGVRLTSLIPPSAREQVNAELARNGMPFDIGQLKPDNLEDLISHNAISYTNDRSARNWSMHYYIANAKMHLDGFKEDWDESADIDMSDFNDSQTRVRWEIVHRATVEAVNIFEKQADKLYGARLNVPESE